VVPTEPEPTTWVMPDPATAGDGDLIAVGADLEPGTILAAYRAGLFPMPVEGTLGWWSPDPRGILPLDGMQVSRSLRKACRRFEIRVDAGFEAVLAGCADPARSGAWITPAMAAAYTRLHDLGWVHSVEAWEDDELVGGLYGVALGGFFAGESMFHRRTDASKAALVALVELLAAGGAALLDVQWATAHLASLGAAEVSRDAYLERLGAALTLPLPALFGQDAS